MSIAQFPKQIKNTIHLNAQGHLLNNSADVNLHLVLAGSIPPKMTRYGLIKERPYYRPQEPLYLAVYYQNFILITQILWLDSFNIHLCSMEIGHEKELSYNLLHKNTEFAQFPEKELPDICLKIIKDFEKYHDDKGEYLDVEKDLKNQAFVLSKNFDDSPEGMTLFKRLGTLQEFQIQRSKILKSQFKNGEIDQKYYQLALKKMRKCITGEKEKYEDAAINFIVVGLEKYCQKKYKIDKNKLFYFIKKHITGADLSKYVAHLYYMLIC